MNKITLSALLLLVCMHQAFSQDVINAYRSANYIGQTGYPGAPGMPAYYNNAFQNNYYFPTVPNPNFNGEYMIYIGHLPYFNGSGGFAGSYDPEDFFVSYTIETVSFPFSMECAFTSSVGCGDGGTIRMLRMPPANSYDSVSFAWQYGSASSPCVGQQCGLKNVIDRQPFNAGGFSERLASPNDPTVTQVLISAMFMDILPTTPDHDYLPHTVLKHTVNFHCGNDQNSNIISSISWIYDNTRGLMRSYPFYPLNDEPSQNMKKCYDILYVPEIRSSNEDYTGTENCEMFGELASSSSSNCGSFGINVKGGTINYFPFSEIQNTQCNHAGFTPVQNQNTQWYDGGIKHVQPNPYTLLTGTFPKNEHGALFAGMESDNGSLAKIGYQNAWSFPVHAYIIDNSINLSDINFTEKKIYNPSEVDITASDLRFPANYTFLTARGVYAYVDDYLAQTNMPENDFAFYNNDYRQFPIETDLRYDGTNPDYLPHQSDPRYASIYRLLNGSKLTVEPCVHIYDCTFDLKPGSEMVFENWSTNQHNVNRYNVLKNGGTLTKRDHSFLFQNRNENENILKFESGDFIKAGEMVDPGRPAGTYALMSNSEVHFKANTFIDLQPGFTVDAGAEFTASIDNVLIPPCPPMRKANPKLQDNDQLPLSSTFKFFQASPNPSTKEISFILGLKHSGPVSLMIYDVFGKLVNVVAENKYLDFGEYSYKYNLENLRSGIYFARLTSSNEAESIKFIKY